MISDDIKYRRKHGCTCTGPAAPAHEKECPVRILHPRVDLGDMDDRLVLVAHHRGVAITRDGLMALRDAFTLGRDWGKR